MRTKEQLITILANHKKKGLFDSAQWSDLVSAISGIDQTTKDEIVGHLVTGEDTQAGYVLRQLLLTDAEARAETIATDILADDTISLAELDTIL